MDDVDLKLVEAAEGIVGAMVEAGVAEKRVYVEEIFHHTQSLVVWNHHVLRQKHYNGLLP